MNESELNLIREYVHLTYLIKEAVSAIEYLPSFRISLIDLLTTGTKQMGKRMRDKLRDAQKELRASGIHVWIEDDGGEVIFVCTAKNGVKERHGMKRKILLEDIAGKLDVLCGEFMGGEYISEYKVEVSYGDPYANL